MTRLFSLAAFFALATGTFALLGSAQAQSLANHNSNAPVNFVADRIEVQDRADRVVVSGNVVVDQAGLNLKAARMTVAYRQVGSIEIDRIDASGNVIVTRGNETARGNIAIYDLNRRLITMLGNVQLDQGSNRLAGGRLLIDLASGRSTVDGRSAAGPPGSVTGSSGRVSGTFTVPQRTSQP